MLANNRPLVWIGPDGHTTFKPGVWVKYASGD